MRLPRKLVFDAGALIEIERNPRGQLSRACDHALEEGARPLLPAVVWAQVYRRASRQVTLTRLRKVCQSVPFTDETADQVSLLLARSGTHDVVDAAVVVAALQHESVIITSDPNDMKDLGKAVGVRVEVLKI
jgi:predicted nucleic acid-binding protein